MTLYFKKTIGFLLSILWLLPANSNAQEQQIDLFDEIIEAQKRAFFLESNDPTDNRYRVAPFELDGLLSAARRLNYTLLFYDYFFFGPNQREYVVSNQIKAITMESYASTIDGLVKSKPSSPTTVRFDKRGRVVSISGHGFYPSANMSKDTNISYFKDKIIIESDRKNVAATLIKNEDGNIEFLDFRGKLNYEISATGRIIFQHTLGNVFVRQYFDDPQFRVTRWKRNKTGHNATETDISYHWSETNSLFTTSCNGFCTELPKSQNESINGLIWETYVSSPKQHTKKHYLVDGDGYLSEYTHYYNRKGTSITKFKNNNGRISLVNSNGRRNDLFPSNVGDIDSYCSSAADTKCRQYLFRPDGKFDRVVVTHIPKSGTKKSYSVEKIVDIVYY